MVCELYFKLYKSMERSKKKIETINNFMTWGHAPLTFLNIPFQSLSMYIYTYFIKSSSHTYTYFITCFYICMCKIFPL